LEQGQIAPVQLQAATDAYTQKLSLYNNGLAPLSDLTQALYNLNKAEADLALINNTAWKALLYKAAVKGDVNIILNQF
jgi:outer membrane protein TolC